jgi:hypothetical protein
MANVPLWEQEEYVLNLPNGARQNNVAGAGGNNIVENVVPYEWKPSANKNRSIQNNVRREQAELRNRARASSKKRIINNFVGRPNRNYELEDEARAMGLNDGDIAVIRNQIARMRRNNPELVAEHARAQAIMNENNNNGDPDANLMGGKRRRRRATRKARKTRKVRKHRKTHVRKH